MATRPFPAKVNDHEPVRLMSVNRTVEGYSEKTELKLGKGW